jgi:hypothetical protein
MNTQTTTPRAYQPTTAKLTAENYPYGYTLRTTAFYSLEFRKGKGFRSVFQTINPKTGKLNAPKRGTYSAGALMYINDEGHIKTKTLDFYGMSGILRDCQFIGANFDLFTPEQIQHFYAHAFNMLKVSTIAQVNYAGAKFEDLRPLLSEAVDACTEGIKTGANVFDRIRVDLDAWEACAVPNYNPFTIKSVTIG